MKNRVLGIAILIFVFLGCDSEELPTCVKTSGKIVSEEFSVDAFEEIIVYERVKLFIEQGDDYKVKIETGENLREDVYAEVVNNRLELRNENSCNLFRDYEITKIYVTTPSLNWLQNSSGISIESIGSLNFPELWLRSFNQERDPNIHTNGDFILDLEVENLRITNDNFSNYFLTGNASNVNLFFANGDGRLEAGDFIVEHYEILHRGTNKLIINPQQSLKGDIFGFGDIISKNRPPEVNIEEHYTGRLIFETP
ncbi:Putative auto-transporter adhesin, head GIN domain [Salegentibacter holothuriorum]|uniref:Putative auto-transporter adhesin, head GIN domain n=1 Tax=Salegentibacter holothuriorum TaxID=241145 RepID=A0A1T5DSX0_9FLAO|nr:head GIN domain-containing protein [Salegentibacter holothuriorum]SKB74761.1 Putative auto-transporter adhesin, head GIN domain [Salegentibacter holothuriorum]